MRTLLRVVVTRQPTRRVIEWCRHKRQRVAKKYRDALVVDPKWLRKPEDVIDWLRQLYEACHMRLTPAAERRLARLLRRSGKVIR